MVVPLCSIRGIKSKELGRLLERVGVFLREDGKYQQAGELLTKAVDITNETGGGDNLNALDGAPRIDSQESRKVGGCSQAGGGSDGG